MVERDAMPDKQPAEVSPSPGLGSGAGLAEVLPEDMQRIWARRAAELARPLVRQDESDWFDVVIVRLGQELYGLEARYILDIRLAEHITPVPRVPDWVRGVVNVRGHILSVVDIQRFLGLPCLEADAAGGLYLIVVETAETSLALLVDDVLAVDALPASLLQDPANLIRGLHPEQVRGLYRRSDRIPATPGGDGLLVVLDLPALLADRRMIIHEEVA